MRLSPCSRKRQQALKRTPKDKQPPKFKQETQQERDRQSTGKSATPRTRERQGCVEAQGSEATRRAAGDFESKFRAPSAGTLGAKASSRENSHLRAQVEQLMSPFGNVRLDFRKLKALEHRLHWFKASISSSLQALTDEPMSESIATELLASTTTTQCRLGS